jgi:hypothetical protein
MGWMVWDLNLQWGKMIFSSHTCPDWPWGPFIIQYNRYHSSVLEAKWLLYGINHLPRLVLSLRMNRTISLLPFCASMACYRETFTVTTACCCYVAADSIDEAVFVQHLALWFSSLDQLCGILFVVWCSKSFVRLMFCLFVKDLGNFLF